MLCYHSFADIQAAAAAVEGVLVHIEEDIGTVDWEQHTVAERIERYQTLLPSIAREMDRLHMLLDYHSPEISLGTPAPHSRRRSREYFALSLGGRGCRDLMD